MHATERGERILGGVAAAAALNWFFFFAIALWLGGTALNGRADGGRYFLGDHGKLTEVTAIQWYCNYAHTIVSFAGIVSVFATMVGL